MEKWSNNHHLCLLSIESCIFCMASSSRHSIFVIASWLNKFWRLRQLAFDQGVRLAREWKSLWSLYCGGQRKTIGGGQLSLVIIISVWSFSKVLVGEAFGARVSLQVSHLSRQFKHCHHHHCHHPNHNHLHHFQASVNEYLSDHSPRRLIFSEEVR